MSHRTYPSAAVQLLGVWFVASSCLGLTWGLFLHFGPASIWIERSPLYDFLPLTAMGVAGLLFLRQSHWVASRFPTQARPGPMTSRGLSYAALRSYVFGLVASVGGLEALRRGAAASGGVGLFAQDRSLPFTVVGYAIVAAVALLGRVRFLQGRAEIWKSTELSPDDLVSLDVLLSS